MRNRARTGVVGLLGVLWVAAAGCGAINQSGDVAATKMGDLSNPPAARANADAELTAACGEGSVTPAGLATIHREPYLQEVTDHSALVLWTSAAQGTATVTLTKPTGETVAAADAQIDATAPLPDGRQLLATIEGLQPATIYCYEISENGQVAVERVGFKTAPALGSGAPVRFIAFGDNGDAGPDQDAVLGQMMTVPFDFFINTGDIARPDGTLSQFEDIIFKGAAHILRSFPMFPAAGNHDYGTEQGAVFRQVFALFEDSGDKGKERYYSYDWGDAHFVALDTEEYSTEQAMWLDSDLTANQRPWVIVYGHRPPYSSGYHGSDPTFQKLFVPILERHHVPLVFVGHDHDYERTKPINGVTYVVTGGGGAGTRSVGTSSFTAFSEQVLHFVYVTIEGNTLTMHAIDGTGVEFDSAVIKH